MKAIVVIRNLDEEGKPVVPATWTCRYEDNDWYSILKPDLTFVHARKMAVDGTKAAFVVVGPDDMLRTIYQNTTAWTIAELRADTSLTAKRIKSAWKDDRPAGSTGPLIALYATMAGYVHDSDLESTTEKP